MSHVYPFKFDYVLPANQQFAERIVRIQASFTSHAFTRKCEADETPHPHYCAPGEARMFDHERYGFSQLLPKLIRNIGNRKCFFAKYDNFFVIELPEGIPVDSEYCAKRICRQTRALTGRTNGEENYLQSPRLKGVGRRETKTTALEKENPANGGVRMPFLLTIPRMVRTPFGRADAVTAMASQRQNKPRRSSSQA